MYQMFLFLSEVMSGRFPNDHRSFTMLIVTLIVLLLCRAQPTVIPTKKVIGKNVGSKPQKSRKKLLYCFIYVHADRGESTHACAKTWNFESSQLPETDPKIWQHLIFCSLGLNLLIYHFEKPIYPTSSLSQIAR